MGNNDAAEMLIAAQAECLRLEHLLTVNGIPIDDEPTPATGHHIVWTLERDFVDARAICDDEDCLSRYTCGQDCDVIYDIRRDDTGVSHGLYGHDDEIKLHLRHEMTKGTFCNVVEFLNADTGMIPELHEETEPFEIGRTAIEPVWQGEDGVTWKRTGHTS